MATKALVLGGGGPVGIAWESGLLAGLAEAGVDLSDADFIVGTSAGSFVGAHLAMGRTPASLATPILQETAGSSARPAGQAAGPPPDLTTLFRKMKEATGGNRPAQEVRAEIGAWALQAKTMTEEVFISSFGRFIATQPENAWPTRAYACTAVDAQDGSFVVWNNESGVGLARGVASSCCVPGVFPPITIRGRRYVDGGMRSPTNADVATGYDRVVVVAVRGAEIDPAWSKLMEKLLDSELDSLRTGGAKVELVVPDAASVEAFGLNLMDSRRRPDAARAGIAQGRNAAAQLSGIWRS